ncbi:hypothetical protein [Amycolatopsis alkalitolerans]|uniref:Uncharacterized protein n=1 Tax=Amycolatopsis alkalitolerans TaxID=2547244 RepID=A0A5C4LWD6_9PSEU|nr:hypothetical protein [Amycolatopsis alkalitolerans]TNC22662.1 hypothetical protein FG385_24800 [Amycolatopsis alkalitolerans]
MLVFFHPRPGGGTRAVLHRDDGVTLEMHSYDRKWRVPHDLAHAVAERELGLSGGVFGCIAGGALFASVRVIDGRARYDAAEHGRRVIACHEREIAIAEMLSGAVHGAVEQGRAGAFSAARAGWESVREDPFPYTEMDIQRATSTLTRLADAFAHLPRGTGLRFEWPRRLTAAAAPKGRSQGRPGRRRAR